MIISETIAIIIPGSEDSGISVTTNFFVDSNRTYKPSIKKVMATNLVALFSILSSAALDIFPCCLSRQIKTRPDSDSTMLSSPKPIKVML